jgi:hypothetical protein
MDLGEIWWETVEGSQLDNYRVERGKFIIWWWTYGTHWAQHFLTTGISSIATGLRIPWRWLYSYCQRLAHLLIQVSRRIWKGIHCLLPNPYLFTIELLTGWATSTSVCLRFRVFLWRFNSSFRGQSVPRTSKFRKCRSEAKIFLAPKCILQRTKGTLFTKSESLSSFTIHHHASITLKVVHGG